MKAHFQAILRIGTGFLLLTVSAVAGCSRTPMAPTSPPAPAVTVAHPVSYPVQSYLTYNGYLDSIEMVQVKARVRGLLTEVFFTDGEDVEKGKLLYTIEPGEYEAAMARADADIEKADADATNANAQINLAEVELKRLRKGGEAVAQAELDKAEASVAAFTATRKIAQANRRSAEAAKKTAKLNFDYTKILAPISGRISRTLITAGNLVGQNETTLLTNIVRMDKLYVYFDAPERDLVDSLQAASSSSKPSVLEFELGVATEDGFPHKGVIDFRENRVDPGTGTIRIRGRLDNLRGVNGKDWALYPGLFSRVQVPAGIKRERIVIPEVAIMSGQEGHYVYVLDEKNIVQKRTVKIISGPPVWRQSGPGKPSATGWALVNPKPAEGKPAETTIRSIVAIETGLEAKDVVIVSGLQKVRPGSPAAPEEWVVRQPSPAPKAR